MEPSLSQMGTHPGAAAEVTQPDRERPWSHRRSSTWKQGTAVRHTVQPAGMLAGGWEVGRGVEGLSTLHLGQEGTQPSLCSKTPPQGRHPLQAAWIHQASWAHCIRGNSVLSEDRVPTTCQMLGGSAVGSGLCPCGAQSTERSSQTQLSNDNEEEFQGD